MVARQSGNWGLNTGERVSSSIEGVHTKKVQSDGLGRDMRHKLTTLHYHIQVQWEHRNAHSQRNRGLCVICCSLTKKCLKVPWYYRGSLDMVRWNNHEQG